MRSRLTLLGVAASLVLAQAARADVTLTYVGNAFDTFVGSYACPPSCNLEASFTVSGSLTSYLAGPAYPPNTVLIKNPNFNSFTFSDGMNTVTDQTIAQIIASGFGNNIFAQLEFVINGAGQPDFSQGWIAVVSFNPNTGPGATLPLNYISSISQGSGGLGTFGTEDQTYDELPSADAARISNSPGTWTVTTTNINAPVPEPSTWAMLILGFAGIGFMAYRRKLKPALMAA